jgi:hypothetical protein
MEPVLGMIYLFADNFAPAGYALCDGQLVRLTKIKLFSPLSVRPMEERHSKFRPSETERARRYQLPHRDKGGFPSRD